MAINLVEMVADGDDCAFDQPCKFGHRVEGHAVYCHNDEWYDSPRKCRRTWYTGGEVKDETCPGFQPNPAFKGEFATVAITGQRCAKCGGTRLFKTDRNSVETCPRCMGEGVEPQAIELTAYEQDTLEIGCLHSGKHSAQHEFFVRVAITEEERESIYKLSEINLVDIRSVTFALEGVFLLRLTGKGDATMRANWKAKKGK